MDEMCRMTKKGERDLRLIEKIVTQNDQKAIAKLFKLYFKAVYLLLYKLSGSHEKADYLTIATFEKVLLELGNYKHKPGFSTRLFKTATNICISDMIKNNQRVIKNKDHSLLKSEANTHQLKRNNKTSVHHSFNKQQKVLPEQSAFKTPSIIHNLIESV